MNAAMSSEQWDNFDRLIQEIDGIGPQSASQLKLIAASRSRNEEACVRQMVLAYYAIAVDPIRSYEGRCVGNYQLGRLIGEGAMGAVYLGEEQTLPYRNVAVKLIHPRYTNTRLRKLFLQQIDLYQHLDHHPHIVPLLAADIFTDPQTSEEIPYYVMPYIQGNKNLKQYASLKRLSDVERLYLFKSICTGIRHLHKNGITHGDLKPSNILVDREGHPYIIDFGLDIGHMSDCGKMVREGSSPSKCFRMIHACYAAGERTDISALGSILAELFGEVSSTIPTTPSLLTCLWYSDQNPLRTTEHMHLNVMQTCRRQMQRIVQQARSSAVSNDSHKAYRTIDEIETDIDSLIKDVDAGPVLFRPLFEKPLFLLGIGLTIELLGYVTNTFYAKTGGWVLIHMVVALLIISLFLYLTLQYIRYLAPVFNRTLTVAYGTGFIASMIGGIIYAFGPPAHTDLIVNLNPVWHIKLIRFMATGLVLPGFYASILAIGAAKRKDPDFRAAEWRIVAWLLLLVVIGTLIFTCVHLIEHPILSMFLGDRMQGDVRCEIFILVAYLCTLSLICFENWQTLSSSSEGKKSYIDAPFFLSRIIVAFISLTLSGIILSAVFWGQGLTPNVNDGAYAMLTIALISVWSITCFALFTGNHTIVRWVESFMAPHFQSKSLLVRVVCWLNQKIHLPRCATY